MHSIDLIRSLHEHRLWARLRLLAVASQLSPEQQMQSFAIGPGSVHNALVHLYGAEFAWLSALDGTAAPRFPEPTDFDGLPALLRAWSDLDERWGTYLGQLSDGELTRPITRVTRAGLTFTTPAADVLIHVCTHAFYHTAQIVNMFRQLGVKELPETNFITMARERSTGARERSTEAHERSKG